MEGSKHSVSMKFLLIMKTNLTLSTVQISNVAMIQQSNFIYHIYSYALGFPSESKLVQDQLLRECSFGAMEGVHYDGMPDHQKEEISDPNYQYPEGESFNDVRKRGLLFLNKLPIGTHLIFTHGGVICSLLQDFGIDEMPDN